MLGKTQSSLPTFDKIFLNQQKQSSSSFWLRGSVVVEALCYKLKVANPEKATEFFNLSTPSNSTMALRLSQSLTEMSIKK
jgi:hypothetical protein